MAHEFLKEAKASHERKLKAYGKEDKHEGKAKNWAGFDALNTNEQRGLKPLDKEPELSKETMPRIMRKAGGRVHGADSLKRLDKAPRKGKAMGGSRVGEIPTPQEQEDLYAARAKGGKVSEMAWEHSKKDLDEDRKLARKHGMSLEKWEESALDKKHDKQQSMEGLKDGGRAHRMVGGYNNRSYSGRPSGGGIPTPAVGTSTGLRKVVNSGPSPTPVLPRNPVAPVNTVAPVMPRTPQGAKGVAPTATPPVFPRAPMGVGSNTMTKMEKGGRVKKADGGSLHGGKKKNAGKTTVNVIIGAPKAVDYNSPQGAQGGAQQQAAPPPPPPPQPPQGGPPQGAPPMMGPPPGAFPMGGMGMPPGAPPMGGMGMPPGGMPIPRKDGGKVQVPYKKAGRKDGYPAMDFGSGSGFGRKQKIDAYGEKPIKSRGNY